MTLGRLVAVVCASLLLAAGSSSAQTITCPAVPGYTFYALQDIAGGHRLDTTSLNIIGYHDSSNSQPNITSIAASLATVCNGFSLRSSKALTCNAFTTFGDLLIVPGKPKFTTIDTTDGSDVYPCDGVYVADGRNPLGVLFSTASIAQEAEAAGAKAAAANAAVTKAAAMLSASLRKHGFEPRTIRNLKPAVIKKAADAARVPLAISDTASGISYTFAELQSAVAAPSYYNYTATGTAPYPYISPVKDQGGCGSCVAFATAGGAEAGLGYALKNVSNAHNLAEQWLFSCNPSGQYGTCSGGWWPSTAASIVTQYGFQQEACFPYTATDTCSKKCDQNAATQFSGKWTVTNFGSTQMQQAKDFIAAGGTIMTFFSVYNDFFSYSGGVYRYNGYSAYAGGHAVLVIGFDDVNQYWVVKNSWGSGWGESGYFRMAYGQCGLMSGSSGNMIGMKFVLNAPAPTPSPTPAPAPAVCNNGVCDAGETCASCPGDCGVCPTCGDGVCNGAETCLTCPGDCGGPCCGNGKCETGESCSTCSKDCGTCSVCGDRVCNSAAGETCGNCQIDCGKPGCKTGSICGDGKCTYSTKKGGYRETCSSCSKDCGVCSTVKAALSAPSADAGFCGDGMCQRAEGNAKNTSCAADCGSASGKLAPGLAPWHFPGLGVGSKDGSRKCGSSHKCATPTPQPANRKIKSFGSGKLVL